VTPLYLRGVKFPHKIEFAAGAVVTRNPASWPAGVILALRESRLVGCGRLFPHVGNLRKTPFNKRKRFEKWYPNNANVLHVLLK
jgi:hypothetical protein